MGRRACKIRCEIFQTFSTSEGFPHWRDASQRPVASVTDHKARRWRALPRVPPSCAAFVLAAFPLCWLCDTPARLAFCSRSPVSREGALITSKEQEQPPSILGSEWAQTSPFGDRAEAILQNILTGIFPPQAGNTPRCWDASSSPSRWGWCLCGRSPVCTNCPRPPPPRPQVTADDTQSSAVDLTPLSAFIYYFFSFCSWREANHIVKAFKNTNQRKLGFQALSRCCLPTVYFQESLGNHCHFSLGFSEKPSVWSGTSDLYLPLANGKQSPVSVLKPRLTSVPWTRLPQLSCVPSVWVASVQALLVAVALQTGGDGVSLSLFGCHHPSFEWKSKCHSAVWKSPPVTAPWDMLSPETRRPPRSWVTSVETGSVRLDCVLSSRSMVFGPSWRWVRIW